MPPQGIPRGADASLPPSHVVGGTPRKSTPGPPLELPRPRTTLAPGPLPPGVLRWLEWAAHDALE
eukprot:6193307-Alexandrium_andersonii.AAC.1